MTDEQTQAGPFPLIKVAGVPIAVARLDSAVEWLANSAIARSLGCGASVHLVNSWSIALADRQPYYREALVAAGVVNLPDGLPVARLISARSGQAGVHVRGPSLFRQVLDVGREQGVRHFLLGGTDESMAKLLREIDAQYPGVMIVGSSAPPYGPVDEAFVASAVSAIGSTNPDIVWVALGTPKQDVASNLLSRETGLNCVAVGAAFDFLAGTVKEAPRFLHGSGMEWLYRLVAEPSRLWRRYLVGNIEFLKAVFAHCREDRAR